MIVLVSLIVYIAKKTCSHYFSHGASLHQHFYTFIHYVVTAQAIETTIGKLAPFTNYCNISVTFRP